MTAWSFIVKAISELVPWKDCANEEKNSFCNQESKSKRYEQILNSVIIIWSVQWNLVTTDVLLKCLRGRGGLDTLVINYERCTLSSKASTLFNHWKIEVMVLKATHNINVCLILLCWLRPCVGPVLHTRKETYKMALELLLNWNIRRHQSENTEAGDGRMSSYSNYELELATCLICWWLGGFSSTLPHRIRTIHITHNKKSWIVIRVR